MRGYGDIHPTVGELRVGYLPVTLPDPVTGEPREVGEVPLTECEIVAMSTREGEGPPRYTVGYDACLGHNEVKAIAMAVLDRAMSAAVAAGGPKNPSEDPDFVLLHVDGIEAHGFCIHYKMPHYVTFQSEMDRLRRARGVAGRAEGGGAVSRGPGPTDAVAAHTPGNGFGYLDEDAKRELRRAIFKAVCVPGHQTPYASRELPIARGFGTGGLQITPALIGPEDVLKVIDQGSDDSVNAASLRRFFPATCPGLRETRHTPEASLIQTRHRIPEVPLRADQILILQVPYPDPLVVVEPNEAKRRLMHGRADYAKLWVKLYEDMVRFAEITISHRYPTRIAGHYVIDPSPIPRYDVPKLHRARFPYLFGAGREKRIYAVPPHTEAEPLTFEDVPFRVEDFTDPATGRRRACARCGSTTSFLDEFFDEDGARVLQCSDTAFCEEELARVRGEA